MNEIPNYLMLSVVIMVLMIVAIQWHRIRVLTEAVNHLLGKIESDESGHKESHSLGSK